MVKNKWWDSGYGVYYRTVVDKTTGGKILRYQKVEICNAIEIKEQTIGYGTNPRQ